MRTKNACIFLLATLILPSQHALSSIIGEDSTTDFPEGLQRFRLLIIGDSISDTGNTFIASNNSLPNPQLYFHGRANDRFVWPDYLDANTNGSVRSWAVVNYASFAAPACPLLRSLAPKEFVLSLPEQVSKFLGGVPPLTSRDYAKVPFDAVVFLGGVNDYYIPLASLESLISNTKSSSSPAQKLRDTISPSPHRVVSCIMDSVSQLVPHFQKPATLLVAGLPNTEKSPLNDGGLPKVLVDTARAAASVNRRTHNNLLKARISSLQSIEHPKSQVRVKYLDLGGLLDSIDLSKLGITITDKPCLQYKTIATFASKDVESMCKDPSKYFFYDPAHFTSIVHRELAKGIATALAN